jgi:hypothetical protein
MLRRTQMMNLLLLAKQGNHRGMAPEKLRFCRGWVTGCSPRFVLFQEFLPRNIRY